MTATVTVTVVSADAAVLVPSITDAIQASLAYLNQNNLTAAQVRQYQTNVQTYLAQAQEAADQAVAAAQILSPANFIISMTAALQSLPTTLPSQSGVPWNNGGTISLS